MKKIDPCSIPSYCFFSNGSVEQPDRLCKIWWWQHQRHSCKPGPKPVKKNFKLMYPTATQVDREYKSVYYGTTGYTESFHLGAQKWEANYNADGTFVSAYPKVW
ncbi:hypothetical protein BH10BAC2_BH10BAC2_35730 [soil metagenome]